MNLVSSRSSSGQTASWSWIGFRRFLLLGVASTGMVGWAGEVLTVKIEGAGNTVVAPGSTLIVSGTISNHTGRTVQVEDIGLFVDTVPARATNIAIALAADFVSALGAELKVPASGYAGPLFCVKIPSGVGPPISAVCQLGFVTGTNATQESWSERTSLNLPFLEIQNTSSGNVLLVWSNASFRPAFSAGLGPNRGWQLVTNLPIVNGPRYSTTLPVAVPIRYFRLEEP